MSSSRSLWSSVAAIAAVAYEVRSRIDGAIDETRVSHLLGSLQATGQAKGAGGRISRALVLDSPPDAGAGEITDKGYIAQSLARSRRAEAVERLFSDPVSFDVMVF